VKTCTGWSRMEKTNKPMATACAATDSQVDLRRLRRFGSGENMRECLYFNRDTRPPGDHESQELSSSLPPLEPEQPIGPFMEGYGFRSE
jgi:hypothetical protein